MNNLIQKIIDLKKENDIYVIAHHYAQQKPMKLPMCLGIAEISFLEY